MAGAGVRRRTRRAERAPEVAVEAREVAHDQLGAGQIATDVAQDLHDVVDARRAPRMRSAGSGKAQHVLELGRPPGSNVAISVRCRQLAGDGDGAVAAKRCDTHPADFQRGGGRLDARHGEHEMLEPHLGRAVGQGDIVGMVGAGEQRLVDPDGAGTVRDGADGGGLWSGLHRLRRRRRGCLTPARGLGRRRAPARRPQIQILTSIIHARNSYPIRAAA